MKVQTVALVALLGVVGTGAGWSQAPSQVELELVHPDGTPVAWDRWIAANGPVALVVWASWAPRSGEVLEELGELRRVAAGKGLSLALVAVQEEAADSRKALEGHDVTWFHDGRGTVLKRFRVVRVPSVVILDAAGRVEGRLDASAGALDSWEPR